MGTPLKKSRAVANDMQRLPVASPAVVLPFAAPHIRHVRLTATTSPRQDFSWTAALCVFLLASLIFMLGVVAGTVFWFTYDAADAARPGASSAVTARLAQPLPKVTPIIETHAEPVQAQSPAPVDILLPAEDTLPEENNAPTVPLEPHVAAHDDEQADIDAVLDLARDKLDESENAPALALYERALMQDPGNHAALEGKAYALARLAAMPDAPPAMLKALQHLVETAPNDAVIQAVLAKSLAQHGDVKEAIAHLDRAARLAPADVTARFNLAVMYDQNGQVPEALALYGQILQLAGDRETPILPPETLVAIRQRAAYLAASRIQEHAD